MKDKRWPYIYCILLQALIYGIGNPLTKIAYQSITPFWCLTVRFGLATLIFTVLFGKRAVAQLRTAHLSDWLPAGLCMAVAYIACNVALDLTSATNVGFLMSLPIIFAPFLEVLILKRPYRLIYLSAQLTVVAGLFLLCCNGGFFSFGWGEGLSLFTSVAIAGSLVYGERGLRNLDVFTISAVQIWFAFILSLPGAICMESGFRFSSIQPAAWVVILYLVLLCTCLAFALQNMALTRLPSVTVSLLLCSEPVFTAAASRVILGETLTSIGLAGAVVIIICIVVENYIEGNLADKSIISKQDNHI
jgi:drug/metabolite transporter (DMT)-like permease